MIRIAINGSPLRLRAAEIASICRNVMRVTARVDRERLRTTRKGRKFIRQLQDDHNRWSDIGRVRARRDYTHTASGGAA